MVNLWLLVVFKGGGEVKGYSEEIRAQDIGTIPRGHWKGAMGILDVCTYAGMQGGR